MSAESPFELSRATIEDMAEMISVMHRSFPPDHAYIFTGLTAEDDLSKLVENAKQEMRDHSSVIWMKVVEKSTGKIIAGSEWRVDVSHASMNPNVLPVPWLEGELKDKTTRLMNFMNENRAAAMKGPFVYLQVCFTDSAYRRRGAGALMMQWGVDLADLLYLPAWIEASADGNFLYKTFGFHDYEKKVFEGMELLNLKRDARTAPIIGGKDFVISLAEGVFAPKAAGSQIESLPSQGVLLAA